MAVVAPFAPNLSGSYGNIQEALKQGADIASQTPGGMGAAAAVAAPVANYAKSQQDAARELDVFKYKTLLNEQVEQRKQQREFEYKGGISPDDTLLRDTETQMGVSPGTLPDSLKKIKFKDAAEFNTFALQPWKEKEFRDNISSAADTVEKSNIPNAKQRADLMRAFSRIPGEKLPAASEIMKLGVPNISPESLRPVDKSKDNFWRDIHTFADGTTRIMNDAPESTPAGEQAVKKSQLRPEEQKVFKQNQVLFQKDMADIKHTHELLDKVDNSVKSDNSVGFFNTKTQLLGLGEISKARAAAGEIAQEIGDPSLLGKSAQKIKSLEEGNWTDNNKKLILEYVNMVRNIESAHAQNRLNSAAITAQSQLPDPERVDQKLFATEYGKPIQEYLPKKAVPVQAPDISTFKNAGDVKTAFQSGKITKDQAAKILKLKFGF